MMHELYSTLIRLHRDERGLQKNSAGAIEEEMSAWEKRRAIEQQSAQAEVSSENRVKPVGRFHYTLMVAVALGFDGLQALLLPLLIGAFINTGITLFAWLMFWIWFKLFTDIDFWARGGVRALIAMASFLVELMPFLNGFPAITAGVIAIVLTHNSYAKSRSALQ